MQMAVDSAEPFRTVADSHVQCDEVGDFNFSAYERAYDELGGFNFDLGDRRDACSKAREASISAIYGVEAFFELSDAAKSFCDAGYGSLCEAEGEALSVSEESDDPTIGWVSPRISFSQDLSMVELEASRSNRTFPEKRKWQGGAENGELSDGCSSEFEFLSNGVAYEGVVHQAKEIMLSADELFSDGKLLPMLAQETASPGRDLNMQESKLRPQTLESSGNEVRTHSYKLTSQDWRGDEPNPGEAHQKLMARHLSFDLPRPNSSSIMCGLAPVSVSVSVDNSPCSSPPRSSAPPSNATSATPPAPHKASSKYSSKIKEFFKPKKMSTSINPQLTRDNSITSTSTCRIPIPPRSFWPFSRSNSAGESKTATSPLPTLPPRSNSAGESNTSRVSTALTKSNEAGILESDKNACISHGQDTMVSASEDASHSPNPHMDGGSSAKDCIDVGSSRQCTETLKQANGEDECAPNTSQERQTSRIPRSKGKASGSPGRATRRRYMYTSANFLRGSPGRRGGMNSLVKVNAGRIVLKNLERCSADRKLCRETSGKRAVAYPVALRVSPVINVAVYRGKVPSSGMFGLRSLFSSKKEKAERKDAAINNWRAGA